MKYLAFLIIPLMFFFIGCDEETTVIQNPDTGELLLVINGLEDLGSTAEYEGWLIVNGNPVTTGKFSVDASGNLSQTMFDVDQSDLDNASTFVLTIEPKPDPDPAPSAVHILAGDFTNGSANLTVGHSAAIGSDFTSATGKFILATPTTTDTMDENSGIWFLDLTSGMPMTGLNLRTLPAGWKYEGWSVINGTPVTTGKFTAVDMMDEDAPFSGPGSGPPFPGEDFIMNAPSGLMFPTMLDGGTGVISIEPDPDNSPAPFLLKPLVGAIPNPADDHTTYDMMNNASGTNPTGTATR